MEKPVVVMTNTMSEYLEHELSTRFTLLKLWTHSSKPKFFKQNSNLIKAVVGDTSCGADAEMIESLPRLEIVASYSVGLDKIDLVKCRAKGIRVTNTPDVLTDDVADLAIGLIMAVLRRVSASDGFVRSGKWKDGDFRLATKFSGKSVGIVGLGRIGSAIAKRAEAFHCPITCALTQETHHIVNHKVIDALGPNGILINIGRGAHIDEHELVSALLEGRLAGARLDVYENEPEVPEQLLGLDNVVLLPHVGSNTEETSKAMADLVIKNLEAYFGNKPQLTPVL
ncbi:hypothetical protein Q3G72_015423 [Acer saccharum]|nr:hypothetical protein Q3G72_015423 [Acer saccharum]